MEKITTLGETLSLIGNEQKIPRDLEQRITAGLDRYGAVELETSGLSVEQFKHFRDSLIDQPSDYGEASTPRSTFAKGVWSATDLPSTQGIAPHNESSFRLHWPRLILFGCVQDPESGGETTLTDVRIVLETLPEEITKEFRERGWLLVRNYHEGLGRTWQDSFGTDEKSDVLSYCRENEIEAAWREDGVLRTKQVRPAIRTHPTTGEEIWFNHIAFWHPSSLAEQAREYLESEFGTEGMPFSTYYGDGGKIPDDVVATIRECYRQATINYQWSKGQLVLVDNMLVAHGRLPFVGERKILVGMGDPDPS